MTIQRLTAIAALFLAGTAAQAAAQTSYVTGSFFGDIVRTSHVDSPVSGDGGGGGEAVGVAVRVGTPLGATWGVELEYAHPSAIEDEIGPRILDFGPILTYTPADRPIGTPAIFPPVGVSVRSEQRTATLSASLWAQQQVSGRLALVYLGGVGFYRVSREDEILYSPILGLPLDLSIGLPSIETESVQYGVRPLVGLEARYSLGDRLQLVPGVRMHGMQDGWTVRPSIGLAWRF